MDKTDKVSLLVELTLSGDDNGTQAKVCVGEGDNFITCLYVLVFELPIHILT